MRRPALALATLGLLLVSAQTPSRDENPHLVWLAGPMEVRAAFADPIGPSVAEALVGQQIEILPPPEPLRSNSAKIGTLRIAGARLADGGRTLVLATDPHPLYASYALRGPGGRIWSYGPTGVEATFTEADAEAPSWSIWWPCLDLGEARTRTTPISVEHERAFGQLRRPGRLALATFLEARNLGKTIQVESGSPFEGTVNYTPFEVVERDGRYHAEAVVEPTDALVEFSLAVETGRGGQAPDYRVTSSRPGFPDPGRVGLNLYGRLPWVPPPLPFTGQVPAPPYRLAGGDPARGEAVFYGEEAKCSACHQVNGKGGNVGPDLSKLAGGDRARVYRDIAEPSAVIHSEYQPYSVALKDGRVVAGVVRAEGADKVRISDISAQATVVDRSEVAELRPSSTSIMPVGLAGALGEERMRDLIAFLTARTK